MQGGLCDNTLKYILKYKKITICTWVLYLMRADLDIGLHCSN